MSEPTPSSIPVTILAGFLGAGKTTLLNRILRGDHGLRIAILVNDFGEINIDSQLIDGQRASDMISLPNGCICCTLFGNLVEVLLRLTRMDAPPNHILIEASGVSQPHQIADILNVSDLQKSLRLDGIITLVDAENVRRLAEVVMFIEGQLADADLIVLNKMDLIDAETAGELESWIREQAPDARIFTTRFAVVPLDLIIGQIHIDRPSSQNDRGHESHELIYGTCSYESDQPFARPALLALMSSLPPSIYRAKGIVWIDDTPERQTIVQVSGRRLRLEPGEPWPESVRRSQLVFIGEPAVSHDAELALALDTCLAK